MKQVNLKDILPVKPEFFIKATNKSYSIRPPNLEDQTWLAERYPQAEIARIFSERQWREICVMVYRHMDAEGRKDFKPRKGVRLGDDGHDEEVNLSGPEVLLVSLRGVEESSIMLAAMVRAMILSKPEIEELVATEVKKNLIPFQKALQNQPIGLKSSTPSPRNTAGRKRK